jgi:hypothetical protein
MYALTGVACFKQPFPSSLPRCVGTPLKKPEIEDFRKKRTEKAKAGLQQPEG